jgi:uncharacterized protein (UPF0548 family)
MRWEVQRGAGLRVEAGEGRAAENVHVTVHLGKGRLAVRAPCVVVYVVEEPTRRGFAYGTLPGHPSRGRSCSWSSSTPTTP